MATGIDSTFRLDAESLRRTHSALVEVFDAEFDLWVRVKAWHRVSAAGVVTEALAAPEEAELAPFLDATVADNRPAILEEADGLRLGIPIRHTVRAPLIAVRRFKGVESGMLLNFAALFQKEYAQRDELLQSRHENQAFLRQVTNDFEELTFLRSMAELLEISDLSFDFTAMAETVLPTLKPLLEAESLLLLPRQDGGKGERAEVGLPTVWAGTRCADPEVCRRLAERFREHSKLQPMVRNYFDETPDGRDFPGVDSFILVPIVNGELTVGWLLAVNRNNDPNINVEELPWEVSYLEFGTHEATLMSSSASILATHSRNVELFREREELLVSVVRALVSAIEAKDDYTHGHSERVALYGKRLAQEMGLSSDYCERLYLTGLLHDVGKIGIRDAVLGKPGPLTDEEFEEIKQHPDKGWAILQDLSALDYVLPGVLHHHENVDGKGYPDRLSGTDIPLDGRILAVADAYDAMTSDRPYRSGMPQKRAEEILRNGAGQQWDAELIDALFRAMSDILHIKNTYQPAEPVQRKKPQLDAVV
jgi:HD-GYP domain-containing protein (c-di-GMP phosphodiesterase class II)